jgi:acyl-CoA synthetase (AMP-forming)/AMP-acid ligase II
LRKQVQDVASALAAAGVKRGDRIGMALPNGVPNVVTFLAAAMAGTAAPLNPAYKEEEFKFYLDDTNAKVLLLPPEGIDEARRGGWQHGADSHRWTWTPRHRDAVGYDRRCTGAAARARRAALVLHTSGSTGRPKRGAAVARQPVDFGRQRRARLRSSRWTTSAMCVMPLFHVHGLVARRWPPSRPAARSWYQRSSARCPSGAGAGRWCHLVLRGAHHPSAVARPRQAGAPRPAGASKLRSSARAARRCRRR